MDVHVLPNTTPSPISTSDKYVHTDASPPSGGMRNPTVRGIYHHRINWLITTIPPLRYAGQVWGGNSQCVESSVHENSEGNPEVIAAYEGDAINTGSVGHTLP